MIRHVSEESILFIHILKWLFLSAAVGFFVGLVSTGFILLLTGVVDGGASVWWGSWLVPFGLALSAWVTSSLVPESGGQGVERVVRAIHLHSGKIRWPVIPAKICATLLTIGSGGSAGNVGPCVQIGSGLSAVIADCLRFEAQERKTLVICGLSAGFSAVFGTPLAGAIFGIEALAVGSLAYQVLFPSAIASIAGHLTASWVGMPPMNLHAHPFPHFDLSLLLSAILCGGVFGMLSLVFVECLDGVKRFRKLFSFSPVILGFLGGCLLLGIAKLVSPQVLGLGHTVIQQALQGAPLLWAIFLGKMITTSITLGFGGSGGIVLPICFVGATSGAAMGHLLNQDASLLAALGLAGLLAGAINTPLTATLLGLELFGLSSGPYLLLTCTIAFLFSGHRSAIPTQLLQLQKAPALSARLNQEIGPENFGEDTGQIPGPPDESNWAQQWRGKLFSFRGHSAVTKTPADQPPKPHDKQDESFLR